MDKVRYKERKSFLLKGEPGEKHELYPKITNDRRAFRVDLVEPEDGVPAHKSIAIFTHPTAPVGGFYMFDPLLKAGLPTLAVSTRFQGSDATLVMERCIQDVGTAIRFVKQRGYERIILLGFSGGASLLCFYQAQAENLTAVNLPDGRPSGLKPEQLPPADKIVLFGHHVGRSHTLRNVLDPAVVDEADPLKTDPELDLFNPKNGPPFTEEFLDKVRAAQTLRMERITTWVKERLVKLEEARGPGADEAFIVHRTNADPFMFEDTSDYHGDIAMIRDYNEAANGLGRFSSLRSWLSQWATDTSLAFGPRDIARTTLPVLSVVQSGDHRAHPDYLRQWEEAIGDRFKGHHYFDATHYMDPKTQSGMIDELAELIATFSLHD